MRPDPIPAIHSETIAAVLDWLERRVDGVSVTDDPWGVQVTREMICTLRQGAAEGRLELAWSPHGLDDEVGPVLAMFSTGGAVLAYLSRPPARRSGNRGGLPGDEPVQGAPGGETHPDW
jgi:hypothetical protein